ncbi:MAG: hypothetical protein GY913_04105 [Proteobacteria bacterium]|nr:hypothetical protein [Pseudomonadota bacterium]MCP4916086.1 hypothetical protein [Pseudomonadota bacterium]
MIPVSLVTALAAIEGLAVRRNEAMAHHSVWRAGGPVQLWICGETEQALAAAAVALRESGVRVRPLDGLRLLVHDGGLEGALVRPGRVGTGLALAGDRVTVGAWESVAVLARWCEREALHGVAHLAGRSGTVGEAARAGALDVLSARVLRGTRCSTVQSISDNNVLISVDVAVERGRTAELEAERLAGVEARRGVGPGPAHMFADGRSASLLAESGLCAVRVRDARVGTREPNAILNQGHANTSDVLLLARLMRDRVDQATGVSLTPSIKALGRKKKR